MSVGYCCVVLGNITSHWSCNILLITGSPPRKINVNLGSVKFILSGTIEGYSEWHARIGGNVNSTYHVVQDVLTVKVCPQEIQDFNHD